MFLSLPHGAGTTQHSLQAPRYHGAPLHVASANIMVNSTSIPLRMIFFYVHTYIPSCYTSFLVSYMYNTSSFPLYI